MTAAGVDVLVIGAGVSGLTSALRLAEVGARVRVWSADPSEASTSMAAGAMWGPYLVEPRVRVAGWGRRSLAVFQGLATDGGSGVRLVSGIEASRAPAAPPEWADQLDGFRMCDPGELPAGFVTGWRFTAPVVDMPTYLGFLQRQLVGHGVTVEIRRLGSLEEATGFAPVVVNCTGIGAYHLVPDRSLMPIRGQLVVVANPGLDEFFSEDTGLSSQLLHWYPQGDTVVLGGQAAPSQWSLRPDLDLAVAIIGRCAAVEPRLREAPVLAHRVGLRPTRSRIRVEAEQRADALVIHNYGHGGAGVTLSWGCAADVTTLALAA